MRRDIEIHINTGDITLPSKKSPTLRSFNWIEKPDGELDRYIYGEITIPASLSESKILSQGIYVSIPYTPKYKEIKLRIKREYGNELDTYISNPVDGTEWFVVQSAIYGGDLRNVYASELIIISEDNFYLVFDSNIIQLYSAHESDFNIIKANTQNKNLMLSCVPSNNYRYPLTGVGLIRWVNSNIDASNLAQVLEREFVADGTPVLDAEYNHELKHLKLVLNTQNVDSNG